MPAQTSLIRRHATDAALLPVKAADGRALAERLAGKYHDRVTGQFVIPGREGRYEPLPPDLPAARYGRIRRAHAPHQLSTLEATCAALLYSVEYSSARGSSALMCQAPAPTTCARSASLAST